METINYALISLIVLLFYVLGGLIFQGVIVLNDYKQTKKNLKIFFKDISQSQSFKVFAIIYLIIFIILLKNIFSKL